MQVYEPSLARNDNELKILEGVFDAMGQVGVEKRDMNGKKIGAALGMGTHSQRYVSLLEDLGILTRRLEYGNAFNGMGPGRHWHWTLQVPLEEARTRLTAHQEKRTAETVQSRTAAVVKSANARRGKKTKKKTASDGVAVATSPKEETRAIAGPDAPSPFEESAILRSLRRKDESAALVEAARQYSSRGSSMTEKVQELAEMAKSIGLVFDPEKALDAFSFEPDERLEAVALVLPYIERLERTVERQTDQLNTQREKAQAAEALITENARLRRRVEALVSQVTIPQTPAAQSELASRH